MKRLFALLLPATSCACLKPVCVCECKAPPAEEVRLRVGEKLELGSCGAVAVPVYAAPVDGGCVIKLDDDNTLKPEE